MKSGISFRCIPELLAMIFIAATVQPILAGDGTTRHWGVFVGISDYQNVNDLSYGADDAAAIYNLFLSDPRWDASRMTLLRNSEASRAAVSNALTAMSSSSDDDDICLFFFSGHGGQANVDFSPVDESDERDEYLVCWDSTLSDYSGDFIDDDLRNTLGQIRGTIVVMLDACFSGGNIKTVNTKSIFNKVLAPRTIKYVTKPFEQRAEIAKKGDGLSSDLIHRITTLKDADDLSNIIVLTSSDDDEVSYESPEFRQGTFTYFFMLGLKSNDLNSNGYVSAEESFSFLKPQIIKYTNSEVTPQIYDGKTGEVSLVKPTSERLAFIGSGDFTWRYPFNTFYQKQRAEYIYTRSQLGQGGYIKALKIFVGERPVLPLNNCTIRMRHTTNVEYDSAPQWTSSGWTTVYAGTKTISDLGPVSFKLSNPFRYDGTRNLIIDFSFSNPSYTNSGLFYGTFSDRYSMIYHSRDDDNFGEPTTWVGASPTPVRDENPPGAGSYLDLEIEFYTKKIPEGANSLPWLSLLLPNEVTTPGSIRNGTFELANTAWTEYSSLGNRLISSSFPQGVTPHSGSYAVWFGDSNNQTAYIRQSVAVPPTATQLTFYHWIQSQEAGCNYDHGNVRINSVNILTMGLCISTNTGGWIQRSINISQYAGQTITLEFGCQTDSSIFSNYFVDDISLQ